MKRFIMFLIMASILCLTGCEGGANIPFSGERLNVCFTALAEVQYGGVTSKASIKREDKGTWTLTFSEPFALVGMTFVYAADSLTATFDDLKTNVSENEAGLKSAISVVMDTINTIIYTDGQTVTTSKGVVTVSGKTDEGIFNLNLCEKDLKLISLEIPDIDFKATFSEVQYGETLAEKKEAGGVPDVILVD